MISGCQRYIVEVRDMGTFIRDIRKNQGVKIFTKYFHTFIHTYNIQQP